jgi:lysophospholipase L1-like esterase
MTISTQTNKTIALGNGATTVFNYDFYLDNAAYMSVIYTDNNGVNTVVTAGQYTLTGVGNPAGGTLTLLFGSPIANGTKLTMMRVLPFTQPQDIVNQSGFYPEVIETGLDLLEMQIQQVNENIGRTMRLDVSESFWDALGKRVTNSATPSAGTDLATKNYVDTVVAGVILGVIPDHSLAPIKLQQFPTMTLFGNNDAITADGQYLTVAEVNTMLGIVSPGSRETMGQFVQGMVGPPGVTDYIACRGDSLTYGLGPGSVQVAIPYPAALQLALRAIASNWSGATVLNRGVGGSNALDVYNKYLADYADVANWATNGGGAKVQIISVGTNSALANPETTTQFRDRMRSMIQAMIDHGQLPILMTPQMPSNSVVFGIAVSPYSVITKQLAMEFDLFCVDAQLQIGWNVARHYDGLHYSQAGYYEMGWHLAALFATSAGGPMGPMAVGANTVLEYDSIFAFPTEGALVGNAAAKLGFSIDLTAAQHIVFALDVTEDVIPIFSMTNAALVNHQFSIVYANSASGVPATSCLHDGARVHRRFRGPLLPKGLRVFSLNCDAVGAKIESLRFVSPNDMRFGMAAGFVRPARILGIIPPGLVTYVNGTGGAAAAGKVTDLDYGIQLTPAAAGAGAGSGSELVSYCTLVNTANRHGFVFSADLAQVNRGSILNGIEVLRGGGLATDLVYRVITNGVNADTTVAAAFAAADVTGNISIRLTGSAGAYLLRAFNNAGAAMGAGVTVPDAWAQAGLYPGRTQYAEVPTFNIATSFVADLT